MLVHGVEPPLPLTGFFFFKVYSTFCPFSLMTTGLILGLVEGKTPEIFRPVSGPMEGTPSLLPSVGTLAKGSVALKVQFRSPPCIVRS